MSISKEAKIRREEIIACALKLFAEKGFRNTSVSAIIEELKIAKGTFYYYFTSKEEILDAAIASYVDRLIPLLEKLTADSALSPIEKLGGAIAIAAQKGDENKAQILRCVHQEGNELLHEKSIILAVKAIVPYLAQIIEEGNRKKVFCAVHAQTTAYMLLISGQFLFDERFFKENDNLPARVMEFIRVSEKTLGAKEGTLSALAQEISL